MPRSTSYSRCHNFFIQSQLLWPLHLCYSQEFTYLRSASLLFTFASQGFTIRRFLFSSKREEKRILAGETGPSPTRRITSKFCRKIPSSCDCLIFIVSIVKRTFHHALAISYVNDRVRTQFFFLPCSSKSVLFPLSN